MKTIIKSVMACAAVGMVMMSCNKAEMTPAGYHNSVLSDAGMANVTFRISDGVALKSTTASENNKVNHMKFFIFEQSGTLLLTAEKDFASPAAASSGSDTVNISVPVSVPGMKVYAVANSKAEAGQWANVTTEDKLKACVSKLSSNSADCMAAIGMKDNLTFTKDMTVEVPVRRFGAKVTLEKITTAFVLAAHQASAFELNEVFLTNVQPECPYTQTAANAAAAKWYNQRNRVSDASINNLISESGLTEDIKNGSGTKHYFYCYPNTTVMSEDSHDTESAFTARRTRLVLKTKLGGVTYYYPVTLPGTADGKIESNKTYTITDLKITGIGVDDPEKVIEKDGVISCKVKINDWETGESWTVEY